MTNAFNDSDQVGLQSTVDIEKGEFIIEYVGEVINENNFSKR